MSTRKRINDGLRLFRWLATDPLRAFCHRAHRQHSPAFARSAAWMLPACGKENAARLLAVRLRGGFLRCRSRKTAPAEAGAPLHGNICIRVLPADYHHPAGCRRLARRTGSRCAFWAPMARSWAEARARAGASATVACRTPTSRAAGGHVSARIGGPWGETLVRPSAPKPSCRIKLRYCPGRRCPGRRPNNARACLHT